MRSTTITPRALTAAEAAHRLGVEKPTLYRLIRTGRIPAARIGPRGDYRIDRGVLDSFLLGEI
jgi:excisionase family DNA binding protein